jgi:hypothetical protein
MRAGGGVRRTVEIGGVTKSDLLLRLQTSQVQLNDFARALFAHPQFVTSPERVSLVTRELSVADLGLPNGGTMAEVNERAERLGLAVCPLEVGPHLRLQWLDQPAAPDDPQAPRNTAPPGAVTVASAPLSEDDDTPKGFYLRRTHSGLWLRGYRSWAGHVLSAADRLVWRQFAEAE